MFTKKDVEEARKLMKKFKVNKGKVLIQFPHGELSVFNIETGKITKVPDGKEIFDKPTS